MREKRKCILYYETVGGGGGSSISLKIITDNLDRERFKPVFMFGNKGNQQNWPGETVYEYNGSSLDNCDFSPSTLSMVWGYRFLRFFIVAFKELFYLPFMLRRIRTILGQVYNKVLINFTPVFSQIEGRSGLTNEMRSAYLFAYKISCYFVSYTAGLTAILAPDFICRWMGPERSDSVVLLLIALIGSFAAGIQIPAVCFLFGTSRHRFYSISNSIEAGLIVLSALFLVKPYGLTGMVAGASISTFCIKMFVQPLWVTRALNISFLDLHMRHTVMHLAKVAIFLLPCWIAAHAWVVPTYTSVALLGASACALFAPYICFVGFSSAERVRLMDGVPVLRRMMKCISRRIL